MTQFLPEWTYTEAVMLALPHEDTDWADILDSALDQYRRLLEALTHNGVKVLLLCRDPEEARGVISGCPSGMVALVRMDFNDTWTRDYGPLSVVRDGRMRALDFGFNGWGLKFASDKDNLVNLNLAGGLVMPPDVYRNQRDFVLEGGSVDTDGQGTVLTTTRCLCSPNRNGGLTKAQVSEQLNRRLGCDHVLFLDYGALIGDDTDSHVDTLARMAPDNIILFTGCRDMDDPQFEELLKMRAQLTAFRNAEGEPYNLVELPLPSPIHDPEGNRLPATYANYLVVNGTVFMPTYGQPANDTLAMQTVRIAFPHHKVVGVDCSVLIRQHGSLHCATMQIPEKFLYELPYE